jgi:hypothetical protein
MVEVWIADDCNADVFEYVCKQLMRCHDTDTAWLRRSNTTIGGENTATEQVVTIHTPKLFAYLSVPEINHVSRQSFANNLATRKTKCKELAHHSEVTANIEDEKLCNKLEHANGPNVPPE